MSFIKSKPYIEHTMNELTLKYLYYQQCFMSLLAQRIETNMNKTKNKIFHKVTWWLTEKSTENKPMRRRTFPEDVTKKKKLLIRN
jgi:hypothetical protein